MTVHRLDAIKPEFLRDFPWKVTARCALTTNVTIATALNAGDTIDGITLVAGDRVMLMGQTAGATNGLYVAGVTPARSEHMCTGLDTLGSVIVVLAGTVNGGKVFKNTNTTLPTIDTTALTFAEFGTGAPFGTPAIVLGTAVAAGAAATVIRSDSTIAAFDATVPTSIVAGDTAATGSVAKAARRDHRHGFTPPQPLVEDDGAGSFAFVFEANGEVIWE